MLKINKKLTGNIVAIVTPMYKKSLKIDYDKFKELINWHISQKTNGIVIAGSTGESAAIEIKEFTKLLETAINTANNKLAIIANTGTNNLQATIKKTNIAEHLAVDAALIVTPYYCKPTQFGLIKYFEKISNSTKLPIILYNVPSRTGSDLLPSTVAELAKINNIIGIKEATGKLERVPELKTLCGEKFILLSGDDPSFLEFMRQGGHGVISVSGNVCPKIIGLICRAITKEKNINLAKKLNNKLEQLHKTMTIESNPIPVKWLLAKLGKIEEAYRLPLTNLSSEYHNIVLEAYNKININIKELSYV
jgi:4-hydroxy-tetrahydrodipicolinate synthase